MRRSGKEMLNEIALFFFRGPFTRRHADHALAAAPLRTKRAHGSAFDEASVRDADDAALIGDEVLHVDLAFIRHQLGQAR